MDRDTFDRRALEFVQDRQWGLGAFVAVFAGDTPDLLLVQLGDYAVARYDGSPWTLPGGAVERGEAPSVAVAREVLEECGVALLLPLLRPVAWFERPYFKPRCGGVGELTLLFAASREATLPIRVMAPGEIRDVRWVPADFTALERVPATGSGRHPLQPLPRHWFHWARLAFQHVRQGAEVVFEHEYKTAESLKLPIRFVEGAR
jgi:ADP-ribose pyrophosphatase YjhB (NUDIX family)